MAQLDLNSLTWAIAV